MAEYFIDQIVIENPVKEEYYPWKISIF